MTEITSFDNFIETEKSIRKFLTIGICGPSCSGKTTVCNSIEKLFEDMKNRLSNETSFIKISQDSFYFGGDSETNYDIPSAIDFDKLIKVISDAQNGIDIELPIYDFKKHKRSEDTIKIKVSKNALILVEGILIFTDERLLKLLDLKVFIHTDSDLCFYRRLKRDTKERGRDENEVTRRYFNHVKPSNKKYVYPSKKIADIILHNEEENNFTSLKVLLSHIKEKALELDNIFL